MTDMTSYMVDMASWTADWRPLQTTKKGITTTGPRSAAFALCGRAGRAPRDDAADDGRGALEALRRALAAAERSYGADHFETARLRLWEQHQQRLATQRAETAAAAEARRAAALLQAREEDRLAYQRRKEARVALETRLGCPHTKQKKKK